MNVKVLGFLLVGFLFGALVGYGLAPKGVGQEEYNTLQGQVKELQGKVGQYEGQIGNLQKEVKNYENQIGELEKEVYTVNIAYKEGIGYYLVDKEGRALYYFAKDVPNSGKSACYGECAQKWPVFYEEELNLPPGLNKDDFSVITRDDGSKQLTYKEWPLYYFFKDEKAGDTNGEDIKHVWYVMRDYDIMIAYQESVGTYLVDDNGMTLYYFAKDSANKSVCYGDCAQKWPIFYRENPVVPSVIANDFGEITRDDGTKQTTFRGYPLYYFFKDEKRGDIMGEGIKGVWFVVNPFRFP